MGRKTILCYGALYPWVDYEKTIGLLDKLDDDYSLVFKGIKHPLYRQPQEYDAFHEYIQRLPQNKQMRIIIDESWDSEPLICMAGVALTMYPEFCVANKTRALDMVSCGIPVIVNARDNLYNILDEDVASAFVISADLPSSYVMGRIENRHEQEEADFKEKIDSMFSFKHIRYKMKKVLGVDNA